MTILWFHDIIHSSKIHVNVGGGNMELLVIDGQGGGIGKQIVSAIKRTFPHIIITAVGTNAIATSAMLNGGADRGATECRYRQQSQS